MFPQSNTVEISPLLEKCIAQAQLYVISVLSKAQPQEHVHYAMYAVYSNAVNVLRITCKAVLVCSIIFCRSARTPYILLCTQSATTCWQLPLVEAKCWELWWRLWGVCGGVTLQKFCRKYAGELRAARQRASFISIRRLKQKKTAQSVPPLPPPLAASKNTASPFTSVYFPP